MDNNRALNIIEKYIPPGEEKEFLKNHLENINNILALLQSENEFIRQNNNIDAAYNSNKIYLNEKFKNLICIVDKIEELLSNSICKECGHVSRNNLQQLADYIVSLSELNDDDLFKFVMENKLNIKEPKTISIKYKSN